MPSPEPSTSLNQSTIQSPSAPRHPSPEKPGLYLPTDRTGNEGFQDRRQRLERLQESIHLNPSQLRNIIKHFYTYEHRCTKVRWRPETLYQYVPREFETAIVTEDVALEALQEAIDRSLVRVCQPSAYDVFRYKVGGQGEGKPQYTVFEVIWDGFTPDVPEELQGMWTLRFQEERRKVFWYPRRD